GATQRREGGDAAGGLEVLPAGDSHVDVSLVSGGRAGHEHCLKPGAARPFGRRRAAHAGRCWRLMVGAASQPANWPWLKGALMYTEVGVFRHALRRAPPARREGPRW